MCNLYHMSPRDDFEVYVRRHIGRLWLPEAEPAKPFVGPFDTGLFLCADGDDNGGAAGMLGQWGMIRPGQPARIEYKERPPARPGGKPRREPMLKNNARIESVAKLPAFREAWRAGRRCLIPATWYQEPNWETGKNIWWQLRRADGLPWMLAGLWSEWTDPETGEVVPNYTMLTMNCDDHPLLNRLHKPDPWLPADAQDKRAVVHVEPEDWAAWLRGSEQEARALIRTHPAVFFDQADAARTDALLAPL